MPDDDIAGGPVDNAGTEVTQETPQGNPAWQELYEVLPDSLHGLVAPVLSKWEHGTQSKIQQAAEATKVYEPYQEFVDNKVNPDQIRQAMALAGFLDANPQEFLKQMQEALGVEQAPQAQTAIKPEGDVTFDEQPFDISQDPLVKKLAEQQDVIAGYLAQEMEKTQQAAAEKQLDADLAKLREAGEFDDGYVLALAAQGMPLDKAVKQYRDLEARIKTPAPRSDANLPNILTPGGGVPSERIDPANMTPEQRRAYIIQTLQTASTQT